MIRLLEYIKRISHSIEVVFVNVVRPYARVLAVVQGLSLLRFGAEMLSAIALLPIMAMVSETDPTGRAELLLNGLSRIGAFFGMFGALKVALFFLAISTVLNCVVSVLYHYAYYMALSRYEFELRMELFRRYLRVDWLFSVSRRQGDAMNTMVSEVVSSRSFLSELMQIMNAGIMVAGYLVGAFVVSFTTTIATMVTGGIFMLIFMPLMRKVKGFGKRTVQANRNVMQVLSEFVPGLKLVRSAQMEEAADILMRRQANTLRRLAKWVGFCKKLPEAVSPLFIFTVVGFALYAVHRFFAVSIPEIILTGLLLMRGFKKLSSFQFRLMQAANYWPSLQAVAKSAVDFKEHTEPSGSEQIGRLEKLELNDVSFGYNTENPVVLDGISMSIENGEFIGIVGGSGAGKTTIVDMLIGLLRPSKGQVRVNECDLHDADMSSWRKQIGYVPQDPIFFNDSVLNNITLYEDDIDQETVDSALKKAGAWEVVQNLPKGLDEPIGDRGAKLSGGQRQRLSFARALAHKPSLLLLDEATSALDSDTEREIQESIMAIKGQVAVVAIAHRLSTVMQADRILVLENGRIAESGAPNELMVQKDSLFRRMVESQMGH